MKKLTKILFIFLITPFFFGGCNSAEEEDVIDPHSYFSLTIDNEILDFNTLAVESSLQSLSNIWYQQNSANGNHISVNLSNTYTGRIYTQDDFDLYPVGQKDDFCYHIGMDYYVPNTDFQIELTSWNSSETRIYISGSLYNPDNNETISIYGNINLNIL